MNDDDLRVSESFDDDDPRVSESFGELSLTAITKCINFLYYTFNENSTLLDVGSGPGKVALCAQALLPFPLKTVYGIEAVKHRNDKANEILINHKEYFSNHNISFAHKYFETDNFVHNNNWTHVIAFDLVFTPQTKENMVEFFKKQRQKNDIYFVSTTSITNGNFPWTSIDNEFISQMMLIRRYAMYPHKTFTGSATIFIYKIAQKN